MKSLRITIVAAVLLAGCGEVAEPPHCEDQINVEPRCRRPDAGPAQTIATMPTAVERADG